MMLFVSKEDNHLKHSIGCQWGDLNCWAGKETGCGQIQRWGWV